MDINKTMGIIAMAIVTKICLVLTLPININNMLVPKMSNEVDKFAGAINKQINTTGMIIGKNPFFKSLITCCFLLNILLMYMNNANFAKSEV